MPRAIRRAGLAAALALATLGLPLIGAAQARAATGEVPPGVTTYVGSSLVSDLAQRYGETEDGRRFRDVTTGPIAQVFFFTEDSRAGRDVSDPVVPRPEWMVPVYLGGVPTGVAVVAQDDPALDPHLDFWRLDSVFAQRLEAMRPATTLVHDPPTASWLVVRDGRVSAIVPGSSGLDRSRPLSALDLDHTLPRIDPVNPVTVRALASFGGLVLLGIIGSALPGLLRRRRRESEGDRARA